MATTTPSWQSLLEQYKNDQAAAAKEIERAKNVYNQKMAAGDKAGAEAAHRWADQVRAAAGISVDDPVYGNNPNTYGKTSGYSTDYRLPPPTISMPSLPQGNMSASIIQSLMGLFGGGNDPISNQLRQQAQQAAAQQAKQQRDALNAMLRQYQNQRAFDLANWQYGMQQLIAQQAAAQRQQQYNVGMLQAAQAAQMAQYQQAMKQAASARDLSLQAVRDRLADASAALEDQSFQDSLAARQEMANRGLSGSGLAQDQDTRLLLAKQKNMAALERDAMRGEASANAAYQSAQDQSGLAQAQAAMQYGLNLSKLFSDAAASNASFANMLFKNQSDLLNLNRQYNDLFNQVNSKLTDINEAKLADQLYQNMISQRGQQLQSLLGLILPYDRATVNQMLGNQLSYDQLNANLWNSFYDRQQKDEQFRQNQLIDWAKLSGILPNGSPTLDALQFNWQQQYQNGILNNQQSQNYETALRNNRDTIMSTIDAINSQIKQYQDILNNSPKGSVEAVNAAKAIDMLSGQARYLISQVLGSPLPDTASLSSLTGGGDSVYPEWFHGPFLPGQTASASAPSVTAPLPANLGIPPYYQQGFPYPKG